MEGVLRGGKALLINKLELYSGLFGIANDLVALIDVIAELNELVFINPCGEVGKVGGDGFR